EKIAVAEARRLEIPLVAIVDTNCNREEIDYPVPANDDAIRAVKLLSSKVADAMIEGAQMRESQMAESADVEGAEVEASDKGQPVDVSDVYPTAEAQQPAEEQPAAL